jgi:NAD(P)-dependent dehydrogenase (short-subunit alcohol dehydrogenase family)
MTNVLITGASSGIGAATALLLDRQGVNVFAGVEGPDDGERVLAGSSERLRRVVLDVSSAAKRPDTRYVVGGAGKLASALRPLVPDRLADELAERTTSA